MKLYVVRNTRCDDKKVAAANMEDALHKYRNWLEQAVDYDYSVEDIFESVSECKCVGDYQEEDIIK